MSCGRCGKPILAQQSGSMCANCRSPAAQCSIWFVCLKKNLFLLADPLKYRLLKRAPHSHLPVKTMLFQCAVCSHGGHQACYRRFYAEMPLILLPTPQPPSPASPMKLPPHPPRSTSRSNDRGSDDAADLVPDHSFETSTTILHAPRQLMGHSCAAGCGHVCWVANFREDAEKA